MAIRYVRKRAACTDPGLTQKTACAVTEHSQRMSTKTSSGPTTLKATAALSSSPDAGQGVELARTSWMLRSASTLFILCSGAWWVQVP